jgi:xanthine permease XanP
MTLIGAAMQNCAGGKAVLSALVKGEIDSGIVLQNLLLSFGVVGIILLLNSSRNRWVRMGSIFVGLVTGYVVSAFLGLIDFSSLKGLELFNVPVPFKYGFSFSPGAFIGVALLYVVTLVETIGDITATSIVSSEPIEGEIYVERVSGGVLGDGFNSMLAAVFNTFPNTTFSQNNGIIQLTGVASRYVGYYVACFLTILGLFPYLSTLAALMPAPILGGATLLMFGTVASSGIRIIAAQTMDRRGLLVLAISLGTGLGVTMVPEILKAFPLWVSSIFSSGIITGGLTAILANFIIPGPLKEEYLKKETETSSKVDFE